MHKHEGLFYFQTILIPLYMSAVLYNRQHSHSLNPPQFCSFQSWFALGEHLHVPFHNLLCVCIDIADIINDRVYQGKYRLAQ